MSRRRGQPKRPAWPHVCQPCSWEDSFKKIYPFLINLLNLVQMKLKWHFFPTCKILRIDSGKKVRVQTGNTLWFTGETREQSDCTETGSWRPLLICRCVSLPRTAPLDTSPALLLGRSDSVSL